MVKLRLAQDGDLELMMAWRSNPLVYQGMYSQKKPLEWNEHISWFHSRNKDWRTFIILLGEKDSIVTDLNPRRIGVVTVGQLDHWSPEVGYYIGETSLWGKGYGKEAVRQGLKYIMDYGRTAAHTTIKDDNEASIRLIESLGFTCRGPARLDESWYMSSNLTRLF